MDERITGYAKGIFEMARAEGELERVEDELAAVARAIETSTELRATLTDPQLPFDRKQAVVDDLMNGRASTLTTGLVHLILGEGRASELPAISKTLMNTAAEARDKALAEVRSAVPLDSATIERLAKALGKATGKNVEVKVTVDESLVGGLVARVGDTVIDGSVARRVESLRERVKAR